MVARSRNFSVWHRGNVTNHANPALVSPYYGLNTYRGIIEALNARQLQFSFQWEF
jgi:hypothetical protein